MKNRILVGWSFPRIVYTLMGILMMVQSVMTRQWLGIGFGLFLTSMGLFGLGCASGNCKVQPTSSERISEIQDLEFKDKQLK